MSNDRYKFRVWDCIQKKYLNEDGSTLIEQHPNGDINLFMHYCGEWDGGTVISENVEYTIEQCSGLKDKTGKLIFEGDVVEYYDPLADDHYQGVVTFDDNETTASGYYIKGNREGWQSYLDGSHCRIIGNVHEMEK